MTQFADDHDHAAALRAWVAALHELTATPEAAVHFRDARSRFAVTVANHATAIVKTAHAPAVYGVWLDQHDEPAYIGQTMEADRRLWDLPIGESHHLANTYPPEIWSKIVVVRWLDILQSDPAGHAELAAELESKGRATESHLQTVGLILEYGLQRSFQPQFNARRRTRAGGWRSVDLARSKAIGAMTAKNIDWLYARVVEVWRALAAEPPHQASVSHQFGGVVYPSRIWQLRFL